MAECPVKWRTEGIYHTCSSSSPSLMPLLTEIVLAEQLHAHHRKYEDNDTEHKGQVAQGAHRPAHD